MHEDLAREFPEAVRALSWTRAHLSERRPIVTREPVVWAAVSGIGAGFLVASVAGMLVALMHRALTLADPHAEFSSLAPLARVPTKLDLMPTMQGYPHGIGWVRTELPYQL